VATHRRLDISLRLRPLDYVALHHLDITVTALLGSAALLLTGYLRLAGRHKQPRAWGIVFSGFAELQQAAVPDENVPCRVVAYDVLPAQYARE